MKAPDLHHAFGLRNSSFAAVFTFWDRVGRTLDRRRSPPWWGKARWSPSRAASDVERSAFADTP